MTTNENFVSLDKFLENTTLVKADGETYLSALDKLVSTSSQGAYYHVHRLFLINSISVLEVGRDGRKFFDVDLNQNDADIISYIDTSSDSKLLLGSSSFDIKNRVVVCNSCYSPKRIRIFVNDDTDRVYVSYCLTILSAELRKELMSVRFLVCDNILYKEGCAYAE